VRATTGGAAKGSGRAGGARSLVQVCWIRSRTLHQDMCHAATAALARARCVQLPSPTPTGPARSPRPHPRAGTGRAVPVCGGCSGTSGPRSASASSARQPPALFLRYDACAVSHFVEHACEGGIAAAVRAVRPARHPIKLYHGWLDGLWPARADKQVAASPTLLQPFLCVPLVFCAQISSVLIAQTFSNLYQSGAAADRRALETLVGGRRVGQAGALVAHGFRWTFRAPHVHPPPTHPPPPPPHSSTPRARTYLARAFCWALVPPSSWCSSSSPCCSPLLAGS
jgi:hypothetical protein